MTDRRRPPGSGDDGGRVYDRGSTTGIPRWVKIAGIILIILALLVGVALLVGGGGHGPGRHFSDDSGGREPPAGVIDVHVPPGDAHG